MLIRDARADELAAIGELRMDAYLAGGFITPDSDYAPRLRALGSEGLDPVLVAVGADPEGGEAGERILGTVMLQGWPQAGDFLKDPSEAEIRALAVAPGAQGAGVGRALLAAVVERARAAGVRHLLLVTQVEMKAAHHLYEQAGFVRLPDRDRSPRPGVILLSYGLRLDAAPARVSESG